MTTVLAPPARARTLPSCLRVELLALALAAGVLVCGVALAQEAALRRVTADGAVRTVEEFRRAVALASALTLSGFFALHALRRFRHQRGDGLLLPAVLALCGIGLMTMLAVRDPLHEAMLVVPFAWGVLLGCAAAALMMTLDVERLRAFTYLPLAAALLLSALLVLFGRGPGESGVKVALWGGQPVDVIRFLEVLFLAGYLGRRWEYLRSLQDPFLGRTRLMARWHVAPLDYVLPLVLCLAVTLSFYVLQKDLGPALIMACLFLALYAVASGRVGLAASGVAALVAAFWIGYELGIPSTVRARVAIWLTPWENALRGGDQVPHGLWALATGGLAGTGPGMGDARLVPAAHTDFVLAVVGEELGFLGVLAALVLYAVIVWRATRIALRAGGDYSRFLALGVALGLVLQLLLIAAGVLALVPLSGVVTPFLSYGKSAMIVNLAGIGVLLSIAHRSRPAAPIDAFDAPVRRLVQVLAVAGLAVVVRAAYVQLIAANETMARPVLTVLADGSYRFQDNPRLTTAARELIPRGRILDRGGVPLATGDTAATREYPLGGRTYHLLGDLVTERDWVASNTSFVERDSDTRLRGFDDHATRVTVPRRDGRTATLLRRDYSELIPLVTYRYRPARPEVQRLIGRPRDLQMTIDARLQAGVADLLRARLDAGGFERGAAIVVDVATRQVLASVSYPWPDADAAPDVPVPAAAVLDRVRYGLYPPGSAFKLVTAIAAMRRDPSASDRRYLCERLPDGRVGRRIDGWRRPVRDDALDRTPHGAVSLEHGLVVSCNAYFAQLAVQLGADALRDTAREFDIALAASQAAPRLRATLPFAGFGQGDVLTTPARLAQVAATIAAGGVLTPYVWLLDPAPSPAASRRVLSRAASHELARAMREVVTSGTARVLRANRTAIAGKTGTAELEGQPSHAWFAGFAPYQTSGRQIAFVVLVENGGYGARAAAPIAGAIVDLARDLRIIREENQ